ncbi:MAG: hypothetical protein JWQ40_249 [Segetibacter sp.]|jgi:short-subunit dehydrogenase|nr:hypothetical protein [Segetibacter sp.]
MHKFQDTVVWITGASSGIGEALAYGFAKRGAKLVLSARREQELVRVKAGCKDATAVELLTLDMARTDELPLKVEAAIQMMGTIDILVNCAGISQRSFAIDTSMNVYRKIMEVNYFGTIQLSLAVLPHFTTKNKGQFIVISSVTGKVGLPMRTAYSAAKHALEGFFGALRTETWKTNIKILVVRPGAIRTNIADNALKGDGQLFNKKDPIIEKGISPGECADAILRAIDENKNELEVGSAREKFLFTLNRFLPRVTFNIVKKLGE